MKGNLTMEDHDNDLDATAYYAHSFGENKQDWQSLLAHLQNTALLSAKLGEPLGLKNLAYIIGLLHDLGKYSNAFQQRLSGKSISADHSTAGAQEVTKIYKGTPIEPLSYLLACCIAGHHSGLPDFGTVIDHEQDPTLLARLKRQIESYDAFRAEISVTDLPKPLFPPLKQSTSSGAFTLSFLTRMLYSVLVDADFLETESFYNKGFGRGCYPSLPEIQSQFQNFLDGTQFPESPVNSMREEIRRACEKRAEDPQGLFSLTVPTGGGKTISSMQFALLHAKKHRLNRIIYVIPYVSIIEQNAQVFKNVLGDEFILEHHSNFDWDNLNKDPKLSEEADDSVTNKLRLASENWDIPIIFTTNVQFFKSLFASRSSSSRKVHNMANSVIIFDEAQMIPMGYLKVCLLALSELVLNYNSSAVLCTATQPQFTQFFPKSLPVTEIMPNPDQLYEAFKRVSIENLGKIEDEELVRRLNAHKQALCIVNTRKHARKLFELLPADGRCFHLSTLMYPAHRQKTICEIRKRLALEEPCIVISTQVMEAGVDLDFPVGYRALAGLDSIIQAGGRVNRNRRLSEAKLYVFEPETDAIKRLPGFIAQTGDVARQVLRSWDGKDPICLAAIKEYFQSLYGIQTSVAFDSADVLRCFEKPGSRRPSFDFRTAAERFKMIESDTIGIIVPADPVAKDLLQNLKWAENTGSILRKLQTFTVNVYLNEFKSLCDSGKVEVLNKHIPVLINPKEDYHESLGLNIPASSGGDAIFYDS